MPTDKEILDLIKNTSELRPSNNFLSKSKKVLKVKAEKINQRRRIRRNAKFGIIFSMSLAIVLWFSFFNGSQSVLSTYNSILSSLSQNEKLTTTTNTDPSVLIYHTHNQESFTPYIKTDTSIEPFHTEINITLVGEKLANFLNQKGVNSIHDKTDITKELEIEGAGYGDAYDPSRKVVTDALNQNKDIKLILDLHRDNLERRNTTVELNSIEIPRISFVVSENSYYYEKNLKVATLLHEKLESKYPGVSRGIITKGGDTPESYNQDLHEHSLLLNIGGVENTLEEEYKSAEIIAEVIVEVLDDLE
ncbi:stage II sporulation protein P [Oceanobacillus sp. M65]|uniref:stage II sporulation protein P n=1 Tax=Oceanobacillus sp. M65 TaxID=3457435 RepID=UPI003FCC50FC